MRIRKLTFLRATVLLGTLVTLFGGCVATPTTTVVEQNIIKSQQQFMVLPFNNNSDEKQLGALATRICQDIFFNRGFKLVNQGDLQIYLRRHHIFLTQLTKDASPEHLILLARELRVTTLLKGEIVSANYEETQGEPLPVITLNLQLINATNGKLIASSFKTGHGTDYRTLLRFGVLRTMTQLLDRMITEITDNWEDKGVFSE